MQDEVAQMMTLFAKKGLVDAKGNPTRMGMAKGINKHTDRIKAALQKQEEMRKEAEKKVGELERDLETKLRLNDEDPGHTFVWPKEESEYETDAGDERKMEV